MPDITANPELMDAFFEEARHLLDELRNSLPALDQKGSGTILSQLFRCAHTLKGSSGAVGFEELSEIARALEMIFKVANDKEIEINPEFIRLVSESVETCQKLLNKEEADNYEALLSRLHTICQSV